VAIGIKNWCRLALRRDIVRRAFLVTMVVGTILAVINHGDTLFDGTTRFPAYIKILLSYLVPYGVSTYSSVQAALGDERTTPDSD